MSIKQIKIDWENLLKSGRIPFFEYEISNGVDTDILLVDLEIQKNSMAFCFNALGGNDVSLDGLTRVISKGGNGAIYAKVALKHFDSIDGVLEHINNDVVSYIYGNGYEIN